MRVMWDRDTKVKQDKIGFISVFDNMFCWEHAMFDNTVCDVCSHGV